MAQIATTRLEYLGAVEVISGQQYLSSSFATDFPDATTFIMKSKGNMVNGVREPIYVSIDDTPMFPVEYGEISAFDSTRTPALAYKFSQDCIIVIAKELATL